MNAHCTPVEHKLHLAPIPKHGPSKPTKWLVALVTRTTTILAQKKRQRESRDAFKHLLGLDDSLLKDIGVSRADVQWAASLPTSVNAADALNRCAEVHKKLNDLN